MKINEIKGSYSKKLKKNGAGCCLYDGMFSMFSVSDYFISSCTYVYNYFSEKAGLSSVP